jgi:hypothetical protein
MIRSGLTAKRNLLVLGGAAVGLGGAAAGVLPGFLDALGYLLPALLLLLALLGRRYPGERVLIGLMQDRRARGRGPVATASAARRRPRTMMPRGGSLIAFSLAVRPPPASLLVR